MAWMETCIVEVSYHVLVNGSPTKDFKGSNGLRQWDLLSPFLFVITTEELIGLVERVAEMGVYTCIMLNDQVE